MIKDEGVKKDILWEMYQENVMQGRHLEDLRGTVTTSFIAIYAAILGIVPFDKEISAFDLPLTFLLIGVGIFGSLFVYKNFERYHLHMLRARNYRDAVDEFFEKSPIKTLKESADKTHNSEYPRAHKLWLNFLWIFLHLIAVLIGIGLTIVAGFFPLK
jgi:hypothetical protein